MKWPLNKDFAFTIIDDTDNATLQNIAPVYDYLRSKSFKTTKTVWVYPPKDSFAGDTIQNPDYLSFLLDLENHGFEIQMHNVGSGEFTRPEIIKGLNIFKEKFGRNPSMHINHSFNPDNIYWGHKRFGIVLKSLIKLFKGESRMFYGDEVESNYFWGDLSKKHIKYMRNRVFNGINTLKMDPKMPNKDPDKQLYSNYWFSSSDGHTLEEFNDITNNLNIDKLKKEKGLSIIYTHFASGFVDSEGKLNATFRKNMDYLSKQNGWFVPASEILDYLLSQKQDEDTNSLYINKLDFSWLFDRIKKRLKYGR